MIHITIEWQTTIRGAEMYQEARIGKIHATIYFPDAEEPFFAIDIDGIAASRHTATHLAAAQQWATERIHEAITAAVTK